MGIVKPISSSASHPDFQTAGCVTATWQSVAASNLNEGWSPFIQTGSSLSVSLCCFNPEAGLTRRMAEYMTRKCSTMSVPIGWSASWEAIATAALLHPTILSGVKRGGAPHQLFKTCALEFGSRAMLSADSKNATRRPTR